jgi:hypothetical protein
MKPRISRKQQDRQRRSSSHARSRVTKTFICGKQNVVYGGQNFAQDKQIMFKPELILSMTDKVLSEPN